MSDEHPIVTEARIRLVRDSLKNYKEAIASEEYRIEVARRSIRYIEKWQKDAEALLEKLEREQADGK